MSNVYRAVNWNPFKLRFDACLIAGMAVYLFAFALGSRWRLPPDESFTPDCRSRGSALAVA